MKSRLYLRVLTIADLADPTGQFIPDGMLNGDWQAGSDIHWPHQRMPPPRFWATFRRCLRLAFCTTTNPHQPADAGMQLDTPLGLWHPVPRHTWFDVCRGVDCVYWRIDSKIMRMKKTGHPGFFIKDREVDCIPHTAHPTTFTQIGSSIRTYCRYSIGQTEENDFHPAGRVVTDTLHENPPFLLIGSDASIHTDRGVATCAWMISHNNSQFIQACAHITNISSVTSYRGELEGIYRALRHTLQRFLSPAKIDFGCDNKAAIDKLKLDHLTPAMMIQPEADILLATRALTEGMTHTQVEFSHVYGHQDTRGISTNRQDESPSSVSIVSMDFDQDFDDLPRTSHPRLSRAARVNIICDAIAMDTAHLVDDSTALDESLQILQPPFPFSRALLKIGPTWITSDVNRHITHAVHELGLHTYCQDKYGWTPDVIQNIHWKVIMAARSRHTPASQIRISKILHGWLPVMHMHGHSTGSTQCPGCDHDDETFEHMLRCPHPDMRARRAVIEGNLQTTGRRLGAPKIFITAFGRYLSGALQGQQEVTPPTPLSQRIYTAQNQIGSHMFIRGFLTIHWMEALQHLRIQHPIRLMTKLTRFLWDDVITPLWTTRNNILHNQENFISEQTHSQLGDRMLWYLQHKDDLAVQDQFLARFSAREVDRMTTRTRMEWIRHLDTARDAWTREKATRATGQRLLTDYFSLAKQTG